jgi:hypothetical protein
VGAATLKTIVRKNLVNQTFTRPGNLIDITLDQPYNAGQSFAVQIVYHGVPDPTGLPGGCTRDLVHRYYQEQYQLNGGKQNRYTSLHAEVLFKQGVRASAWRLLLNPLARFIKFYVVKLGFLDGGAGFAHVVIGCNNTFHKYLKLLELQRAAK